MCGETFSPRVEPIQTVTGSGPKRPVMVNEQTHNNIATEAVRIRRIVPIGLEFPRSRIETVEPMAVCANPEITCGVFTNRDRIGTDFWSAGPVWGNTPAPAIISDERFGGCDPEDILTILIQRGHKRFNATARNLRQFLKRRWLCSKKRRRHSTRGHPDVSFSIHKQGVHLILGKTLRIASYVAVTDKLSSLTVELEQTKPVSREQ